MTAGINPICAGSAAGADPMTPTCVQRTFPLPFHAFFHLFTLWRSLRDARGSSRAAAGPDRQDQRSGNWKRQAR